MTPAELEKLLKTAPKCSNRNELQIVHVGPEEIGPL